MRLFMISLLSLSRIAFGQFSGSGFDPIAPVRVAPGQLATFYTNSNATRTLANNLPLPLTLAGVSMKVGVQFQIGVAGGPLIDVPIAAVFPRFLAFLPESLGYSTEAVTVQIPYEAVPVQGGLYVLGIFKGAAQSADGLIWLQVQPDAIHIIRNGDSLTDQSGGLHATLPPLPPAVTHADGSTVTPDNPAKIGETVSIWAVGLGLPSSGTVKTGEANPSPPLTTTVNVDFDFRSNAGPSMPSFTSHPGDSHVAAISVPGYFAPGYVGLYQVNVTIPPAPVPLESCGGVFQSNVTVNLGGKASSDGTGICVASQ